MYENYGMTASAMEYAAWYDAKTLSHEVRRIKVINFSIVEQRQQSLQRLAMLPTLAPFEKNVRFPDGRSYVTEARGDWSRKIIQLTSSLAFKSGDKDEKKTKTPSEMESERRDMNDATVAFYNACGAILTQLGNGDGVYTRQMFEAETALRWVEATAHTQ